MIIIILSFNSSFQSEMFHPTLKPQTKQLALAGAANEGMMTEGAFVSPPVTQSRTGAQSVPDISRRKHDGGIEGGGEGEISKH